MNFDSFYTINAPAPKFSAQMGGLDDLSLAIICTKNSRLRFRRAIALPRWGFLGRDPNLGPSIVFYQKAVSLLVKKQKKCMTQIVLTVPNGEVSFLSTLAEKMGWSFQTSENLVEKFIASCPTDVSISDEEIQAEVNAVRCRICNP